MRENEETVREYAGIRGHQNSQDFLTLHSEILVSHAGLYTISDLRVDRHIADTI
jgi:hypothetical protein